jgi:chorismate dehydratase
MIFAKIDFINLLPFTVFLKKNIGSSQLQQIVNYHKSYPSNINKKFKKREIDAAFISSIKSKNEKCTDLGIIADGEVLSVLALQGEYEKDYQSDTSNVLAQVLGIKGKVLIGDKALLYYHNDSSKEFIDLAQAWKEKYKLPFVFARLCFNGNQKHLCKLAKKFSNEKIFIPQYILKKYVQRSGLSASQIKEYLTKIKYNMGYKEKLALKLFFKLLKQKGL